MTPALQSFLDNLPDEFLGIELELSGAKVQAQLRYLRKRFPALTYDKAAGMSILLQHLDLEKFTNEQLMGVSVLPFKYLESITFPQLKEESYFSPDKPLQDTGSARLYSFIDVEEVSVKSLQTIMAHYNLYETESLKELIINLYYLGV